MGLAITAKSIRRAQKPRQWMICWPDHTSANWISGSSLTVRHLFGFSSILASTHSFVSYPSRHQSSLRFFSASFYFWWPVSFPSGFCLHYFPQVATLLGDACLLSFLLSLRWVFARIFLNGLASFDQCSCIPPGQGVFALFRGFWVSWFRFSRLFVFLCSLPFRSTLLYILFHLHG